VSVAAPEFIELQADEDEAAAVGRRSAAPKTLRGGAEDESDDEEKPPGLERFRPIHAELSYVHAFRLRGGSPQRLSRTG